jgi:(p)ppGpp synthase/HD superfamily hydrolase
MADAYTGRFDDAVAFALAAFRPITRKGSAIPYVTHLFAVTALVGEYGGDEDQLIAAMLHDWLEDVPDAKLSVLEARYGERVARMVASLSDSVGHPKPAWRPRKEVYLAHLRHEPADVKLVSCADKLHNCRTMVMDHRRMGDDIFDRFTGKKDGTLWYYRSVNEALAHGWDTPLLHELAREVTVLHALANSPG